MTIYCVDCGWRWPTHNESPPCPRGSSPQRPLDEKTLEAELRIARAEADAYKAALASCANHASGVATVSARCSPEFLMHVPEEVALQTAKRDREIARLTARVDELLANNTKLVEERRAVDQQAMVTHFHYVGEHPVRHSPEVPPKADVLRRLRFIAEEFFEQFDALPLNSQPHHVRHRLLREAKDAVLEVISCGYDSVDLPTLVDAWADLKYFIVGSEVEFGVDGHDIFGVVHEANMKKFGPGSWKDENGKTRKPPDWQPPDIAGALRRQGWRG